MAEDAAAPPGKSEKSTRISRVWQGESVLLPGQRGLIARAASALLGKE
jgi:hypothetical protein